MAQVKNWGFPNYGPRRQDKQAVNMGKWRSSKWGGEFIMKSLFAIEEKNLYKQI